MARPNCDAWHWWRCLPPGRAVSPHCDAVLKKLLLAGHIAPLAWNVDDRGGVGAGQRQRAAARACEGKGTRDVAAD